MWQFSIKCFYKFYKETMESKTCMHSYWVIILELSYGTEATRESLGLNVENKYMEKF